MPYVCAYAYAYAYRVRSITGVCYLRSLALRRCTVALRCDASARTRNGLFCITKHESGAMRQSIQGIFQDLHGPATHNSSQSMFKGGMLNTSGTSCLLHAHASLLHRFQPQPQPSPVKHIRSTGQNALRLRAVHRRSQSMASAVSRRRRTASERASRSRWPAR